MRLSAKKVKLPSQSRLYELKIPIIGLTGGIGSGKSTVSEMLKKRGHPVLCADELVKEVYRESDSIDFIHQLCPDVITEKNQINFPQLRQLAFSAPSLLSQIESFIYQRLPLAFSKAQDELGRPSYLIYDVPLLFEKSLQNKVDQSVLVYCSRELQKKRVQLRDDVDEKTIENILVKQWPIEDKKNSSDWVIDNSKNLNHLEDEVAKFEKDFFD